MTNNDVENNTPKETEETPVVTNNTPRVSKKISSLADKVAADKYATGRERMMMLGEHYEDVQAELRRRERGL